MKFILSDRLIFLNGIFLFWHLFQSLFRRIRILLSSLAATADDAVPVAALQGI